jgi:hypothetical protein
MTADARRALTADGLGRLRLWGLEQGKGLSQRAGGRRSSKPPAGQSSFKTVPTPRFLVNSALLLLANRSR